MHCHIGKPLPLGISQEKKGYNFAIYAKKARKASICFYHPAKLHLIKEITLNKNNRTGDVWHIYVENIEPGTLYGWRFFEPVKKEKGLFINSTKVVSDPYAKQVATPTKWGEKKKYPFSYLGIIANPSSFSWEGVTKPNIEKHQLIIYEMHIRAFTQDQKSGVKHPGTFLGLIEKIAYLKDLGINAVEWMPIFEFDECSVISHKSKNKEKLYNMWGYSPFNFFCPTKRYKADEELSIIDQCKTAIRELHRNKIEVILDVVYNHTGENTDKKKPISFQGIENNTYYHVDQEGNYINFSGCGNTFHCSHEICKTLIIDSLRYWTVEMQVDGFRFDLASIMTRGNKGEVEKVPDLITRIAKDPVLKSVKLIAEPWDATGLYQLGSFPKWGKWAEWNGFFRDSVRKFIKGDENAAGNFADALCGSPSIYGNYGFCNHSVNFVTAHDGFTLHDLVSYNEKHNEKNGEDNKDGNPHNDSWNCGEEGESNNPAVLNLRKRQIKNFIVALFVSRGMPMIYMGDEYGHTKYGNNNTYCHDNELNWFLWGKLKENAEIFRFVKNMIHFRKNHTILHKKSLISGKEVDWHGKEPYQANWNQEKKIVSYTLKAQNEHNLFIAFNAKQDNAEIVFPEIAKNKKWHLCVQTSASSPEDFLEEPMPLQQTESFILPSYSSLIAKAL